MTGKSFNFDNLSSTAWCAASGQWRVPAVEVCAGKAPQGAKQGFNSRVVTTHNFTSKDFDRFFFCDVVKMDGGGGKQTTAGVTNSGPPTRAQGLAAALVRQTSRSAGQEAARMWS